MYCIVLSEETLVRSRINSNRASGFTLIELLVVIAIIAILAAILFPVFEQARAKARQASCTSNVKQLGLAFMMYVQDYDETFPYWDWGSSYSGASGPSRDHFESMWMNSTYPYIKNAQVYACPGANDRTTLQQSLYWAWCWSDADFLNSNTQPALYNVPVNYGMSESIEQGYLCGGSACSDAALTVPANMLLLGDCAIGLTGAGPPSNNPTDPAHHYIISRVAYPNMIANCFGSAWPTCGAAANDHGDYRPDLSPNASVFDQQARHSGGSLIGYADGHAKWMRDNQITWDLFTGYTGPY